MKRQRGRGRNNNNNRNNNHNRAMDSNGPEVKVRGTASTIYEKYTTLARDAQSSGNRVKAENLRQHAEHYLRVLNIQEAAKRAAQEEREAARAARGETDDDESDGDGRKPRRHHSRRHHKNDMDKPDTQKSETEKPTVEKIETSEKEVPEVVAGADNDMSSEEPKPKSRRKAPKRKPVDSDVNLEAGSMDAAE